tara:strand:+ start:10623 stop:10745 length:123 start_codon:yes stop_codon:yes gene_type:complete
MLGVSGIVLWQWWILLMVTINTSINVVVFFKHRFKGSKDD